MIEKIKHRVNIRQVTEFYNYKPIDHYWRVKCYECPYSSFPRFWEDALFVGNRHAKWHR